MKKSISSTGQYHLGQDGSFVIEDYNQAKPFSNFFPGVADVWGIPMWVFYVNRGQCISSFGVESKDRAILEFQPANKAYRLTSMSGFRTFLKISSGTKTLFWEPFQNYYCNKFYKIKQRMILTAHDLTIEETNTALGVVIRVNYFNVVQDDFPALVRRVTVTNISRKNYRVEMVDGLPTIVPYGMKDWLLKNMSRTAEAWVKVLHAQKKTPYYHLNVEIADTPDVRHIAEGNFYFAFASGSGKAKLLEPIVDPAVVFGQVTDFVSPQNFLDAKHFRVPALQQTTSRTPSAMSLAKFNLSPKRSKEIVSLLGQVNHQNHLSEVVKRATAAGYITGKAQANARLIASLKNYAFTNSAHPAFNLYCGQTFLDNVLRGGLPVSLKTEEGNVAFNVYSRKHGDPERDYNHFVIAPTYFSQGNGNYRDVNQNRRNDVWFNPQVKDTHVINFLSLLQADGYNPLVVKGLSFLVHDQQKLETLLKDYVKGEAGILSKRLAAPFQPGELLKFITQNNIGLRVSKEEFLTRLFSICHKQEMADHGEGFWADHWTYNLDLIESCLAVYPETLRTLLLEKKIFSFYHNTHYVLPRDQRYIVTPKGVRQYHSLRDGSKEFKPGQDNKLCVEDGRGAVYQTTLIGKLLCLLANKAATLDPSGVGIEMEADKPSWYDALNGLPGLLGSSVSETAELKRLAVFLLEKLEELALPEDFKIPVFTELAGFLEGLISVLSNENEPLSYWDKANTLKEQFRARVRKGVEGREQEIKVGDIQIFLKLVVARANRGMEEAAGKDGIVSTYLFHEVKEFSALDQEQEGGLTHVYPKTFARHDLPLFLEGPMHVLRTQREGKAARALFTALRQSALFDTKLKMYKVNASLETESEEIGRTRVFPRGWLENESIWLHMEYKYLLEVLRSGLHEEFFQSMTETMVPFLKPEQYGRSTLENSSFLASSAHADPSLHGQGFVARLSGSTAEFLHIWLLMNVGPQPFRLNEQGKLTLAFKPALPGWLFTDKETAIDYVDARQKTFKVTLPKNTYAFNFLGSTLVVYHNPKRKSTFGPQAVQVKEMVIAFTGRPNPARVKGAVISDQHAQEVRQSKAQRIDVFLE